MCLMDYSSEVQKRSMVPVFTFLLYATFKNVFSCIFNNFKCFNAMKYMPVAATTALMQLFIKADYVSAN